MQIEKILKRILKEFRQFNNSHVQPESTYHSAKFMEIVAKGKALL